MLQLNFIRENKEEVVRRLELKNFKADDAVEKLIGIDNERRILQKNLDENYAEANRLAKEIGDLFKKGLKNEAENIRARTHELKQQAKTLNENLDLVEKELHNILILLPNLPHPSVPPGKSSEDNEIVHQEGIIPPGGSTPKPHWELASRYDIIDFDLGSKVTGAGFPFYKGKGAKLQRALISFFLDKAIETGYVEVQPPLLINEDSGYGTGQIPDKDGQMYFVGQDNLYLIPTAEVPVTNMYRDTILRQEDLPVRNVAYSACFRREAGSYGKDVRGLNRLHQFDKVEIVQICHPDVSYRKLEEMREHVAGLLRELGLPFRIARLCGGDLSFTSAMTYDFEVYSAAQQKWLEVSSVSNFESFQSNRMKLRFKDEYGKTRPAHTLNGSALALPRTVAALLENNQTGTEIMIPPALHKYTGFETID
ncbi:MAG: serine--tRNA ligase [Bacteroidales bacterium]|nr:serine--tRNA ligase [Bacteroidales bacterium]